MTAAASAMAFTRGRAYLWEPAAAPGFAARQA